MGKSSINGQFSIATLNNQRVSDYVLDEGDGSRPGSCPESENGFAAADAKRGADVKGRIKKPKLDKDMAKLKEAMGMGKTLGIKAFVCLETLDMKHMKHMHTYATYAIMGLAIGD